MGSLRCGRRQVQLAAAVAVAAAETGERPPAARPSAQAPSGPSNRLVRPLMPRQRGMDTARGSRDGKGQARILTPNPSTRGGEPAQSWKSGRCLSLRSLSRIRIGEIAPPLGAGTVAPAPPQVGRVDRGGTPHRPSSVYPRTHIFSPRGGLRQWTRTATGECGQSTVGSDRVLTKRTRTREVSWSPSEGLSQMAPRAPSGSSRASTRPQGVRQTSESGYGGSKH